MQERTGAAARPRRKTKPLPLPAKSQSEQAALDTMKAARDYDVKWREGRVFSLVFKAVVRHFATQK